MMAPPTINWFNTSVRQESESVTADTQSGLRTVFFLRYLFISDPFAFKKKTDPPFVESSIFLITDEIKAVLGH